MLSAHASDQPCRSLIPCCFCRRYQSKPQCTMLCSEIFEEFTMPITPNSPQDRSTSDESVGRFYAIPVGGTDPDFVSRDGSKPAVCAIPVLGRMLPQCR